MKAERIQDAPVLIPDWTLDNAVTVQRAVRFNDFAAACHFVSRFAERLASEAPDSASSPAPELDVRQGHVAVRLTADPATTVDIEVDLIDRAIRVNGILQQMLPDPMTSPETP